MEKTGVYEQQSDYLKIIAMAAMLLDHIAYYFLPYSASSYLFMRLLGRLAFPIFAYYIAKGYQRTRNINRYMGRMLVFALISQLPFYYFMHQVMVLNILFTFLLALLMLKLYDRKNLLWVLTLLVADVVAMDYGAYGLIVILIFHVFGDDFKKTIAMIGTLSLIYATLGAMQTSAWQLRSFIQVASVFAIPLIYMPMKPIRISKYWIYAFYPLHLGIIVGIGQFFRM